MVPRLKISHERMRRLKHHWLTVAFVLGFVVDNITLNQVDQLFDNIVLASYVVLAMLSITLLYAAAAERLPERIIPFVKTYVPLLTQYSFGGLLSGMLIFYGRSGSWLESWPFLIIILGVIYGNETIRDRSQRLIFNISVLFIGLFSYTVLVIPVITGKMGAWIFVGSGTLALIIMYGFVRLLHKVVPRFINLHQRALVFSVGFIFATLNFLYFTNIIPPIPLSLKEVGVYHSAIHFENGDYQLTYEKPLWWQFWRDSDAVFHYQPGDNIYCFASVFAPARLSTEIFHRWERYDATAGKWVEHGRFSYPIFGGRGGGYRGYTNIKSVSEGKWRCTVETGRGQVLGSDTFTVVAGVPGELVTRTE
jgi:hypothetical protein